MSISFFSFDNNNENNSGGIKALTGLKSIVIPEERLTHGLKDFMADEKDQSEFALTQKLIDLFKQNNIPEEFREEWTHYSCISRSKIASYLFIRNFQIRNIFSSYLRKGKAKIAPKILIINEVLNYYYEHIIFHHVSFPWIEAHFSLISNKKPLLPFRDQENRINRYIEILINSKKEIRPEEIAARIDADYAFFLRYGYERYTAFMEANKKFVCENINVRNTIFKYLIKNIILNYRVYLSLSKKSLEHINTISVFMLNRFKKGNKNIADYHFLPGILSGKYTIDPRGFLSGKKALDSHEKKYYSEKGKAEADLLWHITERAIFIKSLMDTGLSIDELYSYFFFLNRFYSEWRTDVVNVLDKLFFIDEMIIQAVTMIKGKLFIDKNKVFRELIANIVKIYNKTRNDYEEDLSVLESGLPTALNCSYMHI